MCAEKWLVGSADAIECPKSAEFHDEIVLFREQLAQLLLRGVKFATGFGARGEFEPRLAREPFVGVRMELHQLVRAEFCDVERIGNWYFRRRLPPYPGPLPQGEGARQRGLVAGRRSFAVGDFVDAAAGAMDAGIFVAFARVALVEDKHTAVRAVTDFHPTEPGIFGREEVRPVFADVAAALAFEDFLIGAAAMEIQREKPAAIFGGPIVALINHHPDVRMAATEIVRLAVARFLPAIRGIEVPVVGVLVNQRVSAGIRVDRVRANEVRAGKFMPEMAVDSIDEKKFAVLVPIVAPGIRGAGADCFHNLALRVITPNRAAQRDALLRRRPWHTHLAVT